MLCVVWFEQQKTAVKKLENVRRDHLKRIDELQRKQVYMCTACVLHVYCMCTACVCVCLYSCCSK